MRHGRVLVDRSEPSWAFFVEVKVKMTYVLDISFRATVRVLLEGVQAQVDVRAMRVLVAQPGLEFVTSDLPGRADSLHRLPGLTISYKHGQPVLGFKVLLDVAPRCRLGLLNRIPKIEADASRHFRQVFFICDEYQHFATAGENEPNGDEKFFALSRQSKCIPSRFTSCVLESGVELPYRAIKNNIADSLNVLVHLERRPGRRFVSEVTKISGYKPELDRYDLNPIFNRTEDEPCLP